MAQYMCGERWRHEIRNERGSQAATEDGVRLKRIAKHWLDAPSCIQDLWWHTGCRTESTSLLRRQHGTEHVRRSSALGLGRVESLLFTSFSELVVWSKQTRWCVHDVWSKTLFVGIITQETGNGQDSGAAGRFISKSRTLFTFWKRQYHQRANEYLTRKCAIHR